jgi:hypothetical protein
MQTSRSSCPHARCTDGLAALYWLDAAPPEEWASDFAALRELGIEFAILADWFDVAEVFREEPERVRSALDACARAGLKAYLHVFPAAQMLEPYPIHFIGDERFTGGYLGYRRSHERYKGGPTQRFVDAFGYLMPFWNLWSRSWRQEWLLPYLDAVSRAYANHPALAGYEFSNLLLLPQVRYDVATTVSYSDEDAARYRQWRRERDLPPRNEGPPVLPGRWSADWCDWMAARREWLAEWARETVAFLHERSPGCRVVLHDDAPNLVHSAPLCGGYTPELVSAFDAFVVEHYLLPQQIESGAIRRTIDEDLATAGSLLRGGAPGWRAQFHARCGDSYPPDQKLREMLEAALAGGARRIELDCFRRPRVPGHIFDYRQTLLEHPEVRPVVREAAERFRSPS